MQALSKFLLGAFFVGFPLYPFKIAPGQKRDHPWQVMDLQTDSWRCDKPRGSVYDCVWGDGRYVSCVEVWCQEGSFLYFCDGILR